MATKIEQQITFNDWARKFNVSTLWDDERFENKEFLKKLDEAIPVYKIKQINENSNYRNERLCWTESI
jgi:hypothetical protein